MSNFIKINNCLLNTDDFSTIDIDSQPDPKADQTGRVILIRFKEGRRALRIATVKEGSISYWIVTNEEYEKIKQFLLKTLVKEENILKL